MARAAHARHSAVPLAGAIAVVMLGGLGAGYALLTSGPSHPDHPAAGPAAPSSSATPSPTVGATVAEATAPGPAETTAFPSSDKPPRHRPQSTSSAVQGAVGHRAVPGHRARAPRHPARPRSWPDPGRGPGPTGTDARRPDPPTHEADVAADPHAATEQCATQHATQPGGAVAELPTARHSVEPRPEAAVVPAPALTPAVTGP